jgi:hypothetical protein
VNTSGFEARLGVGTGVAVAVAVGVAVAAGAWVADDGDGVESVDPQAVKSALPTMHPSSQIFAARPPISPPHHAPLLQE